MRDDFGKVCSKCGGWFPLDDFNRSKTGRLGRQARCKRCAYEDVKISVARTGWKPKPQPRKGWAPRVCRGCEVEFVPTCGKHVYCTDACGAGVWEAMRRERQAWKPHKPCVVCGELLAKRQKKYCSRGCEREATYKYVPVPLEKRSCARCGAAFVAKGVRKFCSDDCARPPRAPRAKRRPLPFRLRIVFWEPPPLRVWVSGPCAYCSEQFTALAWTGSRYCSPRCGKRADREVSKARRRVRRQGGDRILRRKVFERDDWTCRICRKPVDREAVVPHPKAPTVDHILPLSLGGEHAYSNVQTAHFICNSIKSANVTQLSFAA